MRNEQSGEHARIPSKWAAYVNATVGAIPCCLEAPVLLCTAAAICVVHYKKELLLLDHHFMILFSLFLKPYRMPARVYCSYFVSRIRMQAFDDSTFSNNTSYQSFYWSSFLLMILACEPNLRSKYFQNLRKLIMYYAIKKGIYTEYEAGTYLQVQ